MIYLDINFLEEEAKAHIFDMCLNSNLTTLRLEFKHKKMKKIIIDDIGSNKVLAHALSYINHRSKSIYIRHVFKMNAQDVNAYDKQHFHKYKKFLTDHNIISRYKKTDFYFINPFFANFIENLHEIEQFNKDIRNYMIHKNDNKNRKSMSNIANNTNS